MNKYLIPIMFVILLVISCEKSDNNTDDIMNSAISILSPQNESDITCEECTIEIISIIENKESADLAYILIDNNIITSGLKDTLRAYYHPPSEWQQTINIEARLVNFLDDESTEIIASDISIVNLNSIYNNPSTIDPVFMNVNNQFSMMRFPVTNREFINFLNTNEYLDVEIVDVIWDDENDNGFGNPLDCDLRDPGDQYEPTEWWYVNVKTIFGNQDIPTNEYSIYKNGYNIYDTNADYSNQGGKIQYDCLSQTFFLPNEEDGSESIFLDHPVTGVSWVGATIYAHHFGWTLPTLEQWEIAAKNDNNWNYPWGNEIDANYANYNSSNTSEVGFYNGLGELNLSLSAFGLYDMAGNVWEHTSTSSVPEIYFKTGGAFDSDTTQLKIGYTGYSIFNQVSNNTGFRCVANINYPSSSASGCMEEDKCNYDIFAESSENCFMNDCLENCGGNAIEIEFFQDLDGDGLGNPNVSEIQCNEPQNGWVDNASDLDDTCSSININQDNIDCDNICNGNAFIDGCGNCVGGETGETECNEDCNGVNGGSAERDDCDVCSGGDTGLEPNQDLDCNGVCNPVTPQGEEDLNNGLEYGAYIDDCEDCVGGGTGLEENYADLGCGCNEPESKLYCLDTDSNGCCDCGNNDNGQWDECNEDLDAEFICEDYITDNHIESIVGCSNEDAENWYCDEQDNQCINFFGTIIPPCNFIDDGSCIVYGCSDPNALNYLEGATECENGSSDSCCEYAADIEADVFISFGTIDEQTMEILIDTPNYDVSGFQFFIEGINISSGSGGLASEAGFLISAAGSQVLGFSFSGTIIPVGSNGILTTLNYTPTDTNACFYLGTGAISDGNGDEIGVQFGIEPETDPDTIDILDDCIQLP